jgi:hypothetical protein
MQPIKNLLAGLLVCSTLLSYSQNCTQKLRLANETYNAGRLHELPEICKPCLDDTRSDHFTKEEKVIAYKLLAQAYIYLEEPQEADKAMLNLLKTDGFFEINPKVDPAEFISQYQKFRTLPVISITSKVIFTGTYAQPIAAHNTGNSISPNGKFTPNISISFSLGAEKILVKNKWTLATEVNYVQRSYTHTKASMFDYDDNNGIPAASISSIYTQRRIDFYPLIQYSIFRKKKSSLHPFVGIGPGVSYLLSSENEIKTTLLDINSSSRNTISGKNVDTTNSFNKLVYSVLFIAGGKFRIGTLYVTGDVRFQYGLSNLANEKRSNQEALFDYGYQIPDFKTHNLMISVGVIKPLFVPKKLIK